MEVLSKEFKLRHAQGEEVTYNKKTKMKKFKLFCSNGFLEDINHVMRATEHFFFFLKFRAGKSNKFS